MIPRVLVECWKCKRMNKLMCKPQWQPCMGCMTRLEVFGERIDWEEGEDGLVNTPAGRTPPEVALAMGYYP